MTTPFRLPVMRDVHSPQMPNTSNFDEKQAAYARLIAKLRQSSPPEFIDEMLGYSAAKTTWNDETQSVDWERVDLDCP